MNRLVIAGVSARQRLRRRSSLMIVGFLLMVLAGAACSSGSYPVDFFFEMHYQDSYAANEPPRLSPPEGSVPWFAAIEPLGAQTDPAAAAAHLFEVNCSMCHGLDGTGNGNVLRIMESRYGYVTAAPPDLTLVQAFEEDMLRSIITNGSLPSESGQDNLPVMPSFEKLLSEQEIRMIVGHIKTLSPAVATGPGGSGVFIAKGCGACHAIDGLEGATGMVGPDLTHIATIAGTRVPGLGAEEYIRQSEEDPQAFFAPGFDGVVMPPLRGTMTGVEFEELVAFLMSLQ